MARNAFEIPEGSDPEQQKSARNFHRHLNERGRLTSDSLGEESNGAVKSVVNYEVAKPLVKVRQGKENGTKIYASCYYHKCQSGSSVQQKRIKSSSFALDSINLSPLFDRREKSGSSNDKVSPLRITSGT